MIISIDIETEGLKINTPIHFVGLYTINSKGKELFKCFQFPQEAEDCRKFITKLQSKGAKFVMHNGKFDSGRLKFSYDIDVKITHDTEYLGYLLSTVDELKSSRPGTKWYNPEYRHWLTLKKMAQRYLNVPDWDVSKKVKTSTNREEVEPYLYCDVKYTYHLFKKLWSIFPERKKKTYELMIMAANAYRDIECNGLPINMNKLEEVSKEYESKLTDTLNKLKKYGDINYNSAPQLQKLLYISLQLPIKHYTDSGAPATGVEALKDLLGEHEIIQLLLDQRKYKKALEFCTSWKQEAIQHSDGLYYLHSTFNIDGTVTGRTSSNNVNLQQIPRDKTLKSLFQSCSPEWELVCEDFSQLELRMAGIVANVKAIKDSYKNGEDLHYKMASVVTGKPIDAISKAERTQAKAANFGFLYSMQAPSFVEYAKMSYGVIVTPEEAENIRYHFFEMYPELNDYYDETHGALLGEYRVTSIMGRDYEINPDILSDRWKRQDIMRACLNFPVQSAGSDYVVCGLVSVAQDPELKDKIRIGATVHDSVIFLVKKDEDMIKNILKVEHTMEHNDLVDSYISIKPDFPIKVDVEIGPLGKGVDVGEYLGGTH